nr:MAG TPA: hypothetical protein [Caudoviricetes sp.]
MNFCWEFSKGVISTLRRRTKRNDHSEQPADKEKPRTSTRS